MFLPSRKENPERKVRFKARTASDLDWFSSSNNHRTPDVTHSAISPEVNFHDLSTATLACVPFLATSFQTSSFPVAQTESPMGLGGELSTPYRFRAPRLARSGDNLSDVIKML